MSLEPMLERGSEASDDVGHGRSLLMRSAGVDDGSALEREGVDEAEPAPVWNRRNLLART